jgi:4-deoxy-L-threo-5-hexosulose-uronate ketol-isomerase
MRHVAACSPTEAANLSTAQRREAFLVTDLFRSGAGNLVWWETDRTILGGFCPEAGPLPLPAPPAMRAGCFLERREAGIINLGRPGIVRADGTEYRLDPHDALYLGRGVRDVSFASATPGQPSRFYVLSYPAHVAHPSRHVPFASVPGDKLGTRASGNERTLHKLIHPGTFPTCQVVMGITRLQEGSVWNSMPPHTHLRRSEIYLYFDLPAGQRLFHFMGEPQATQHLILANGEAVLSPPWSIHCGAGTTNYSFVWGMGGENQEFTDMDPAPIAELR